MTFLWVRFNPYTYARVAGMKGALLSKNNYPALLKMGYHEVLRYLQDSDYHEEITHYNVLEEGLKVVEQALNAQMMRCFQKLYRISDEAMKKVLGIYLWRYDLENIKSIIRAKASRSDAKEILMPSVNFSPEWYQNISEKSSVKEILQQMPLKQQLLVGSDLKKEGFGQNLFAAENMLDRYYAEQLLDLAVVIRGSGAALAFFLREEVENRNLRLLLRLLQAGIHDTERYLVAPSSWVRRMMRKETMAAFIAAWGEHTHQRISSLTVERMETELDLALLREQAALLRREMLSATTILGYLFAKEIEVRNLKIILKAKKLGLGVEQWQDLVVAV